MRIYTANFATETNTFSPLPTRYEDFEEAVIYDGDVSSQAPKSFQGIAITKWKHCAQTEKCEAVEGVAAFAQPAGRMQDAVYEAFRDKILSQIENAGSLDAVLLSLHGAMASETVDDCEGDLLSSIRERVGDHTFLGAILDPHCHLTRKMVGAANALITYKEYPHTDIAERAEELFSLALRTCAGEIVPVMAQYDCKMVGMYPTSGAVMRGFVDQLKAAETQDRVLSASLVHGFPWADVKEAGTKTLVVADNSLELATRTATHLGRTFRSLGERLLQPIVSIREAVDAFPAKGQPPLIVADIADNAGGGAPSDSTFILQEVLKLKDRSIVIGCFWAPDLVDRLSDVPLNTQVSFSLGGTHGAVSGPKLELDGVLKAISPAHEQSGLSGSRVKLGPSAWIAIGPIDLVITSIRSQTFSPDAFTGIGIDLAEKSVIIVKSSFHFEAAFRKLSNTILHVSTPGTLSLDFANLPYRVRDKDYWPRNRSLSSSPNTEPSNDYS
jgi:microcystin degradation protein MlrC